MDFLNLEKIHVAHCWRMRELSNEGKLPSDNYAAVINHNAQIARQFPMGFMC